MDSYSDATALLRIGLRIRSRIARSLHTQSATEAEEKNIGAIYASSFKSIAAAHSSQMCIIDDKSIQDLGLPIYTKKLSGYENNLDSALRLDIQDYMPGDILTKIDRASMAHGVELRAPFLDIDTAEFCMSLPSSLKIDEHSDKVILRSAYADQWPESIRGRRKQGFGAPVSTWLADEGIREMKEQLLTNKSSPLYDLLDYARVQRIISSPEPLVEWNTLCLANWLQISNART
jgi:asparagine synthase (glutamine-hydrolysing)